VGAANELNGILARPRLKLSRLGPITVAGKRANPAKITLSNTGDAPARSVKICFSVPPKLLLRPACRFPGEMLAGEGAALSLKLQAKKGARGAGPFQVIVTSPGSRMVVQTRVRVQTGS
jgi:hypothetical protein